jgi:hypothetical protein
MKILTVYRIRKIIFVVVTTLNWTIPEPKKPLYDVEVDFSVNSQPSTGFSMLFLAPGFLTKLCVISHAPMQSTQPPALISFDFLALIGPAFESEYEILTSTLLKFLQHPATFYPT